VRRKSGLWIMHSLNDVCQQTRYVCVLDLKMNLR